MGVAFLSRWGWLIAAAFALWASFALQRGLVAASVLLRVERAREPAWLVHYAEQEVHERALPEGRLYTPPSVRSAILLVHGMHPGGIEEPRLTAFARALAGAGYAVLTPRMEGLARFRLIPEDVQRIVDGAAKLATLTQRRQVIVFGVSFGGGLAIRAACQGAPAIERVLALGPHHDAERVSGFYLGDPAPGPDGVAAAIAPHPYGRSALWLSLFGHNHEGSFTPEERARARAALAARRAQLRAASPSGCGALNVPLYLVHGSHDRVVPYTETLWIERQLATQAPVRSLLSPAIVHAEYDPPSLRERLALIAFMVDGLW